VERRATVAILAVVVAAVVVAGGMIAGGATLYLKRAHAQRPAPASGPVTAATKLSALRGTIVFSDDFLDPHSGWSAAVLPSGTSFGYADGGYLISGRGTLHHFAEAPFHTGLQQLGMSVTATQSPGAPDGAGFGVTCWRGDGENRVRYEFVVLSPGTWYLERDGGVDTLSSRGVVLEKGTARVAPGASPITIVGMCLTLDDQSTRLAIFVDGSKMVDRVDKVAGPQGAWLSGLDVSSREAGDSAVMVTRFEDRDLSA